MFICSDKLYERLYLLNAGFLQVTAFVNSPVYHIFVRPLTHARSAAWLAGNMTLCYFAHPAILNEKTSFNLLRGKAEERQINCEHLRAVYLWRYVLHCAWSVTAHAPKPDSVFRRKGRVHLNRRVRQFSRLLAAEVCASAVGMLGTPCSEVVWRVLATHSFRQFPLHFPSRASPCAITFQLESILLLYFAKYIKNNGTLATSMLWIALINFLSSCIQYMFIARDA